MGSPEGQGVSRRDVLKAAGATSVVAGVGTLAWKVHDVLETAKHDKLKSGGKLSNGNERIKSKEEEVLDAQIDFLEKLVKNDIEIKSVYEMKSKEKFDQFLDKKFGPLANPPYDNDSKSIARKKIMNWYSHTLGMYKNGLDLTEQKFKDETNLKIVNLGNELIRAKKGLLKGEQDKLQK